MVNFEEFTCCNMFLRMGVFLRTFYFDSQPGDSGTYEPDKRLLNIETVLKIMYLNIWRKLIFIRAFEQ